MTSTKLYFRPVGKTACMLVATMLLTSSVNAQKTAERAKNDSIAAKYKDENAVYINYIEKLEIKPDEEGQLVATTRGSMEKLLISDAAPTNENTDYFFIDDFNQFSHASGVSLIPDKKGGYKTEHNCGFGAGGQLSGSFYDDVEIVQAYYTGLTKNSVTETKYSIENTDISLLPPAYFAEGIPVLHSVYEVTVPNYVKMNFVLKNTDGINLEQKKEEKEGKIIYTFTANNLRAIKRYQMVPSSTYYMPHIIPYITSYRLTGAKQDSVILRDINALGKHHFAYVKDMNIRPDTPLVRIVKELTENDKTDREKAKHIYNWVQQNIHYIGFEKGMQGLVPRPADTVFKRMYGDCKDMASLCMAMCRQAGLKAYFATIGTTDIPYSLDEIPTQSCFNHMICAVKLGDDWVFLDGTDNTEPFGENREDIQGKEAFIYMDATHHQIVKIPVVAANKNVTADSTVIHLNNNNVEGTLVHRTTGYPAWHINRVMKYLKEKDRDDWIREELMRGSDKYRMAKYNIDAKETGSKDASITADFTIEDYAHKVGKEYIVNMNLDRQYSGQRMNDSERKVGYYYPYKEKTKEVVVLDIPEGYKVTHLPPAAHGGIEGVWSYNISYKADKNKIVLTKEYEQQALSLSPGQFANNNKIIDELNHEYKESVVLTTKK
jgi:transglutaminase-like putative cysteine protease